MLHPIFDYRRSYIEFIFRLYAFGKIGRDDYSREVGKYYGYPTCCIENFVNVRRTSAVMGAIFGDDFPTRLKYVQCPTCRVAEFFTGKILKLPPPHPAKNHRFYPECKPKRIKYVNIDE